MCTQCTHENDDDARNGTISAVSETRAAYLYTHGFQTVKSSFILVCVCVFECAVRASVVFLLMFAVGSFLSLLVAPNCYRIYDPVSALLLVLLFEIISFFLVYIFNVVCIDGVLAARSLTLLLCSSFFLSSHISLC